MAIGTDSYLVTFEPDQPGKALELILWQDEGRPNLEGLVRALGEGAQLAEATSFAVIAGSLIDSAEGVTLDRIGELVGETRGALAHESFREFIDLRISVNRQFPGEDAVWSVLAEAVDPSVVTSYRIADGIVFVVTGDSFPASSIASHTGRLIRDFRPAGHFVAVTKQLTDGVRWGSVASPGTAFGDVGSPSPERMGGLIYTGWFRPRPRPGT
jgi:hypothetical protein